MANLNKIYFDEIVNFQSPPFLQKRGIDDRDGLRDSSDRPMLTAGDNRNYEGFIIGTESNRAL